MIAGRNVYGILRAGRAKSTEAIVLSAPYLTGDQDNSHGAAIMLSLAKFFGGMFTCPVLDYQGASE